MSDLDTDKLRGRRVIVVNTSYERLPFANYLFFGDRRWFVEHQARVLKKFEGQIVTGSRMVRTDRILTMQKVKPPPGITRKRHQVVYQRTSLQGAINLALHLVGQGGRIVLLGADMKRSNDGRSHHHSPHLWGVKDGCWDKQMQELRLVSEPLKNFGIEIVNTSMESKIDWWPKVPFAEVLAW